MNENFFGQTAVYVSSPHRAEASCQVSAKSLGWFSGKTVYQPTDQPTDQPTIPSLTSTDVENCNLLSQLSQLQNFSLTHWLLLNIDFSTLWLHKIFQCLTIFFIIKLINHTQKVIIQILHKTWLGHFLFLTTIKLSLVVHNTWTDKKS